MRSLFALLVVVCLASGHAHACDRGCPCGNTCISCLDTCHVGSSDSGGASIRGIDPATAAVVALVVTGAAAVTLGGLVTWMLLRPQDFGGSARYTSWMAEPDEQAPLQASEVPSWMIPMGCMP
jgi:hypothetical protein